MVADRAPTFIGWFRRRGAAPLWGLAIGVLALLIYWPGLVGLLPGLSGYRDTRPLRGIDLRIGDALHRQFAVQQPQGTAPRICVVGISAEDIAQFGPKPWPRERYADLVRQLQAMGASVIAFDFLPAAANRSQSVSGDEAFASAVGHAGRVILPRSAVVTNQLPATADLPQAAADTGGGLPQVAAADTGGGPDAGLVRAPDGVYRGQLREATDSVYGSAYDIGHTDVFCDADSVVRRVPAAVGDPEGKNFYLPLAVAAALAAEKQAPRVQVIADALWCGETRIPLDRNGCILVNYQPFPKMADAKTAEPEFIEPAGREADDAGPPSPIEFHSCADVQQSGRVAPDTFKDAVTLIGWCAPGSSEDLRLTPEGHQYGVLVQAMLLHTVLSRQFLTPVPQGWMILAILATSTLLGMLSLGLRFRMNPYAVVSAGCLALGLGILGTLLIAGLLRAHGWTLDVTPFLMVLGLNFLGGVTANAHQITREAARSSREMDVVLAASRHHMGDMPEAGAQTANVIPGAAQVGIPASVSSHAPEIVAETFWQSIPCNGCALFLIELGDSLSIERSVYHGFTECLQQKEVEGIALRFCWQALNHGRPLMLARGERQWNLPGAPPALRALLGIPIMARGQPLAVAILFNKKPTGSSPESRFTEDHFRLVAALSYQAAALLENARRYQVEYAMFDGFARSLAKAVDFRDRYTRGHSERVSELSVGIAEQLGLTPDDIEIVHRSATLHDLGKIGVTDTVLKKAGRLSQREYSLVRAHAVNGCEILRAAPSFEALLPGILHHHERYDGHGYPDGLIGNDIPLLARIIAAADAYDAMTSDRPYRKALPEEKAREELVDGEGTQFDPQVVHALLRHLDKEAKRHRRRSPAVPQGGPPEPPAERSSSASKHELH